MRFVVFGDSNTYGHGQHDCIYCNTQPPSSLSWPSQLKELIGGPGVEVLNKSIPGSSCILINHCIRSFQFEKDDVVLILWSFLIRSTIFQNEKDYKMIFPSMIASVPVVADLSERMYCLLPEYDFEYKSSNAVEHAHLFLKSKGIPFLSWYVRAKEVPSAHTRDFFHGDFYDKKLYHDFELDLAADGKHLGPKSNRAFAEHVRQAIVERIYDK